MSARHCQTDRIIVRRILSISRNALLINFVTFFLISHAIIVFDAYYLVDLAISIMRYFCFLIILAQYMTKPRLDKQDILWLFFLFYLLFTTIVGSGILVNVAGPAIDIAFLLMLFHVHAADMKFILKAIVITLSFYVYLNAVTIILHPHGLWTDPISGQGYFLLGGNYNGMGPRCLMALATNLLILKDSKLAKLNFALLLGVSLFSVLFVGSMTSTVCIISVGLLWILAGSSKHRTITLGFFVIYIIAQILIVFLLSDLSGSEFIVKFVENVLHKNLTFTRRTILWENSSNLISRSPWLGYGFHDKVWNERQLDGPGAHNFIYTMLLYGGYPLLITFIIIAISSLKNAAPYFKEKQLSRLLLGTNMLFFMMIFEYYTFFIEAYFLTLIYYYPVITQSLEKVPIHADAPESTQTNE